MQTIKKQQQLELPQYEVTHREFRHTKMESLFMFVINYLSLNTKSGYITIIHCN